MLRVFYTILNSLCGGLKTLKDKKKMYVIAMEMRGYCNEAYLLRRSPKVISKAGIFLFSF